MSFPDTLTLQGGGAGRGRWLTRVLVLTALLVPVLAAVVIGVLVTSSKATLSATSDSLARLQLPFGGATVTDLAATVGREQKDLPVKLIGDQIWPDGQVGAGVPVTVIVELKRPGWDSWLAGRTQRVTLSLTTPKAELTDSYVTVKPGQSIPLHFTQPVTIFGHGTLGASTKDSVLATPQTTVPVTPDASAGTMAVSVAARTWELPITETVSWFPAGAAATAVASPAPGTSIGPQSKIRLTFSTPVSRALPATLPAVSPAHSGSWRRLNSHTIQFDPSGYGYGLGARVQVALPAGVHLIGGTGDPVGTWSVPGGSTTRLQQLLAQLGYLPVTFTTTGPPVADTLTAEESAAVTAPAGHFAWRWPNTPAALKAQWQPGSYGELTKAAVMSFEDSNDLAVDGVDGPQVWKALIQAALKHVTNSFGYTFVYVHEASSDETETTWHNGQTVVSGPVNTGTAAAGGTATGVFAVYEHLLSTTMSGVNPDGSHYVDPGIPHVSYFNGGDALHGYIRASYGFPQSDGCVEMPYSEAAAVYPYTPIGTVVDVSTA